MLKKTFAAILLITLLLTSTAYAQVSNREMQMMGGVVVSNATDAFFFAPLEGGVARRWGLYALSNPDAPVREIADGIPARLVHADDEYVYMLVYTDSERTVHALHAVEIATGTPQTLLENVAAAFVYKDDAFMYVSTDDRYTLHLYDIGERKSTKLKDMSGSKKYIYDAVEYDGEIYFLTKTDSGSEDGYLLHQSSGKATNLDKPNPSLATGLLYEGYRVYASDNAGTQIYSVRIGSKNANRIGEKYNVSLASPRFGNYMYTYDGENNQLIALPLDGETPTALPLESAMLNRFVLGGTSSELLLLGNDAVYSIPNNASMQTRLFGFDQATGGQIWSYIAPAGDNAVIVLGYGAETYTHRYNLPPTGVYVFDRASGQMLFGYPAADTPVSTEMPAAIGNVPMQRNEGETWFNWDLLEGMSTPVPVINNTIEVETPPEGNG